MNRSQGNLQDAFLNSARREGVGVTIYLVSGVQLRGVIRAFDAFTVLLESQGRPAQMVYKHAIASVAPSRAVSLETGPARDEPDVVLPIPEHTEAPERPERPERPRPGQPQPMMEAEESTIREEAAAGGEESGEGDDTPPPAPREVEVSP